MKKIILALVCALSVVAFAPEASALPAFSRQTGLACFACHQQHFPVLNNFGRSFKAAGYTMMGTQTRIESDQLSIPATMNAALLLKIRYQKDDSPGVGSKTTGTPNSLGDGQLQFGDEFSLFLGGRVAENIGFLFEGNTASTGSLLAGFKLPISFDKGATRLSVIPFTTDALGVQYGYELSSGGVMRANRWAEHRRETSAIQYNADQGTDGGAATGFALVAQNDMGFINLTKWTPSFAMGANGGGNNSYNMNSSYLRIAATPNIGDWTMVAGGGAVRGASLTTNSAVNPVTPAVLIDTRQTFLDLQAHGLVSGKDLGVYAQYATAPATANGNAYNSNALGNADRKAWTLCADYSILPRTLTIGTAFRKANNGAAASGDDAITVTAVYDWYQNVALHLNYSLYSGSAHDVAGAPSYLTTFMLEAAW